MKLNLWKKIKGKQTSEAPVDRARERSDLSASGLFPAGVTVGDSRLRGALEMIPLFGARGNNYSPPESALTLTQVNDYGKMVLKNTSKHTTIVPLHMGYFQKGAQNHAMCRADVLKGGQKKEYKDACCIQAAQGGYIKDADRRFIVLPADLRERAFALRGVESYDKLWGDISRFNKGLGLKNRGHLDEIKQAHQPELLRTLYYLERHPGQTGAVFLLKGKVVGVELCPDEEYWKEMHIPLIMYCYAPLALRNGLAGECDENTSESEVGNDFPRADFSEANSLAELKDKFFDLEARRERRIRDLLGELASRPAEVTNSSKVNEHSLFDLRCGDLLGQGVEKNGERVYLSLFRAPGVN